MGRKAQAADERFVVLPAAAAADRCYDIPKLIQSFESLGENCDFGVVQRAAGVEPFGLFRFAGCSNADLIILLETQFASLGEAADLYLEEDHPQREYLLKSRRFSFVAHTGLSPGAEDSEGVRTAQVRKLGFLKAQLLRDLSRARKLFVFRGRSSLATVETIATQLRAYGPNKLLWVDLADAAHPPGSVERRSETLHRGFVRRFGTYDGDPSLPVEDWIAVCANAYRLWHHTELPAIPVCNLILRAAAEMTCQWVAGPAATTEVVSAPARPGNITLEHRLETTTQSHSICYAYLPIATGGRYVFSVWIRIPEDFQGRQIGALLHGFPTIAAWPGDRNARGQWQRIWVVAELPDDARGIACGLVGQGQTGDVFHSASWCLERGSRPSGFGFML